MRASAATIVASAGALSLGALAAFGQSAPTPQAGTLTTARIVSDLEFNDNFDLRPDSLGDALIWTNTIGAGLERRTGRDTFLFDAQGSVRVSDLPEVGTDVLADDPRITLNYDRRVDDSALRFGLRFQRADLDYFDPLSDIDPNGQFDNTVSQGTRQSVRVSFGVDLNQNGPISFTASGDLSRIDFTDTVDPDLNDRDLASLRADLGFRVSPVLTLTTGAAYDRSQSEDDVDTDIETVRADVGAIAQINPVLSAQARIGYSESETRRNTFDTRTTGTVGDISLVRTEPTGQIRLTLSTTLDNNGQRNSITVGKTVTGPRSSLDADIGVSNSDDTDLAGVGSVRYTYSLPRTQVSVQLQQQATVDDQGDDVLNSVARLQLTQAITRTSSFTLAADGGLSRSESDTTADSERVNLTASYAQSITQDWSWNAGYRREIRDGSDRERATANAFFVGLRRDFASIR